MLKLIQIPLRDLMVYNLQLLSQHQMEKTSWLNWSLIRCRTLPCAERWTRGEHWSCSCSKSRASSHQVRRTHQPFSLSHTHSHRFLVLHSGCNFLVISSFVYSSGHCSLPDEILRYIPHQGVPAAEDQGGAAEDHADSCSFRHLYFRRLRLSRLHRWTFWVSVRGRIFESGWRPTGWRHGTRDRSEPGGSSWFTWFF